MKVITAGFTLLFLITVSVPLRGSGDERGASQGGLNNENRFSPLAGKW